MLFPAPGSFVTKVVAENTHPLQLNFVNSLRPFQVSSILLTHSRAVYGSSVETRGPYSRHYMSAFVFYF